VAGSEICLAFHARACVPFLLIKCLEQLHRRAEEVPGNLTPATSNNRAIFHKDR
jgi:hypothetical protein